MGIFQASKSYREPAKTMTVKALEARLKSAQEQAQKSAILDQTVADPMQGWAYLMNNLAGQANEHRAERADIEGRDQLAKIKAGIDWSKGMTPEQYAQASSLDPDWADKTNQDFINYRQDMEKQAQQNQFTTSERTGRQNFDAAQNEDDQAAAIELAEKNQAMGVEEAKRKEGLPQTGSAKITQDYNNGLYGTVGSPEAIKIRDAEIAKENTVTTGFGGPAGMKNLNDMNAQVGQFDSALSSFDRALELSDQIPEELLGDVPLQIAKTASSLGGPAAIEFALSKLKDLGATNVTPQQVQALLEYDRIVGLNAMTTMSQTLKGATTDREMSAFIQRLAAPGMTIAERKRMIQNLKGAIIKDRDFTAAQLSAQGYPTNPYQAPAAATPTTTPTTTTAPRPAGEMTAAEREAERQRLRQEGGGQ